MKRFFGLGVAAVAGIALTVLLSTIGGAPTPAIATGTGGTISFGTVSTNTVQVNTTATSDTYNAFNVHLTTNVSPLVTLTSISGDGTGGTLEVIDTVFCPAASAPEPGGAVVRVHGHGGTGDYRRRPACDVYLQRFGRRVHPGDTGHWFHRQLGLSRCVAQYVHRQRG